MRGVIKRSREFLHLMRGYTVEKGSFTVTDVQNGAGVPGVCPGLITCLVDEGVSSSARKTGAFTRTIRYHISLPERLQENFYHCDGDKVQIFHECLSRGCCLLGHHHMLADGGEASAEDGQLLRNSRGLDILM